MWAEDKLELEMQDRRKKVAAAREDKTTRIKKLADFGFEIPRGVQHRNQIKETVQGKLNHYAEC